MLQAPRHPYTDGLRRSSLLLTAPLSLPLPGVDGNPPDLRAMPPGCAFAPRCDYVFERCRQSVPLLLPPDAPQRRACFHDGPLQRDGTDP
jgi:oligopeptide/dipeptide ABC transporter ATP-binding protein